MLRAIGLVLFAVISVIMTITVLALVGGTVVYFCWPVVMVPVFHLPELTWFQAVCLTWICGILLKASQTNNNTK